jgi:hypothetical protein
MDVGSRALRSQNATSKGRRGGRRYAPNAFTEHGAMMLASVLNRAQVIEVSVYVVRAFVQLRHMIVTNRAMAEKLQELERRVSGHDEAIRSPVQTIRALMTSAELRRRPNGFRVEEVGVALSPATVSTPSMIALRHGTQ